MDSVPTYEESVGTWGVRLHAKYLPRWHQGTAFVGSAKTSYSSVWGPAGQDCGRARAVQLKLSLGETVSWWQHIIARGLYSVER